MTPGLPGMFMATTTGCMILLAVYTLEPARWITWTGCLN